MVVFWEYITRVAGPIGPREVGRRWEEEEGGTQKGEEVGDRRKRKRTRAKKSRRALGEKDGNGGGRKSVIGRT